VKATTHPQIVEIVVSAIVFVLLVIVLVQMPGDADLKVRLIQALATLLVPIGVVVAGKLIKDSLRERDVDLEWVRSALDILRDGSDVVLPLKEWAVTIVERFSGVPFDETARGLLRTGDARMPTSPAYIMPADTSMARRYEVAGRILQAVLPEITDWPVHDQYTSVVEAGANIWIVPRGPGGPADPDHKNALSITVPLDWGRIDDADYLTDEVAQALVQRVRYEWRRRGVIDDDA
jgi:hypothetical protein